MSLTLRHPREGGNPVPQEASAERAKVSVCRFWFPCSEGVSNPFRNVRSSAAALRLHPERFGRGWKPLPNKALLPHILLFWTFLLSLAAGPAFAADLDEHNLWLLPGAEIVKYEGGSPDDVTVTVSYVPTLNPELFRYYVSADEKLIESLAEEKYEMPLKYGPANIPNPEIGLSFYVAKEGKYACVYATGPNRQGIRRWRVRKALLEERLKSCDAFLSAFAGAPGACHQVEQCIPSEECGSGTQCPFERCCAQHYSSKERDDHCIDLTKLKGEAAPPEPLADANDSLIPAACWETLDPPPSKLNEAYPNYRSVLGAVAYCIEETVSNLLFPEETEGFNGDTDGTMFSEVRDKMQAFVMAIMALAVIVFGYKYMFGDKKLPERSELYWLFFKLIMVSYFAIGDGLAQVYMKAWPAAKSLSAIMLTSISGQEGVTGGGGGGPDPEPEDQNDLLERLIEAARSYSDILHTAVQAVAQHRELSERFDKEREEVRTECGNLSPYANGGMLLDKQADYAGFLPPDKYQDLSTNKVNDLFNCGVERSCDLVPYTTAEGEKTYVWKAADPALANLYNMDSLPQADKERTCEKDVMDKHIPDVTKDNTVFKNALGGETGLEYRELKRESAELFDGYADYYFAAKRIRNHNILIYYYKMVAEGDAELDVVKGELDKINNQIFTLEKRLAEIEGAINNAGQNNFNAEQCQQDNPEAAGIIQERTRLDGEIAGRDTEITDLNGQKTEIMNANPPPANANQQILEIDRQITELEQEQQTARQRRDEIILELEQMGCTDDGEGGEELEQLTEDRAEIERQLAELRRQKAGYTNEDYTIQVEYVGLLTRLERRLAVVKREDPEYYRELYCALSSIQLDDEGNLQPGSTYADCPMNLANLRPICMDKHLFTTYGAAALLDENDVFYQNILEIRYQCDAIDAPGTGVGEGIPDDAVPAENERAAVLGDFYEIVPFVLESLYRGARGVCWGGGKTQDFSIIANTLPPDDILEGEQDTISANDTADYSATDAPSRPNPYISFMVNKTIQHRYNNRTKAAATGQLPTFPDIAIEEDCDGDVDEAFFDYCVALFGETVNGEGFEGSYTGETLDGLEDFGLHGCSHYLEEKGEDTTPELGVLDKAAALNQLCPERDPDDMPLKADHAWNFRESALNEGAGLNGTKRDYYVCATPETLGNYDTGIPAAYSRLVDLFGDKDGAASGDFDMQMKAFCGCTLRTEGTEEKCIAKIPEASEDGNGQIREELRHLMAVKYEYERAKAESSGLTPGPAGIGPFAAPGPQAHSAIYPYCNKMAYDEGNAFFLLWDIVDCKFQRYLGVGSRNVSESFSQKTPKTLVIILIGFSWMWIFTLILGCIVVVLLVAIVFRFVHLYLASLLTLGILLFFGPLIIPAVLFPQTKGFFDSWLKNTIAMFVQPILIAVAFTYYFMILDIAFFGGNHEFEGENHIAQSCAGGYCDTGALAYFVQETNFYLWAGFLPLVSGVGDGVGFFLALGKVLLGLAAIAIAMSIFDALVAQLVSTEGAGSGGAPAAGAIPPPNVVGRSKQIASKIGGHAAGAIGTGLMAAKGGLSSAYQASRGKTTANRKGIDTPHSGAGSGKEGADGKRSGGGKGRKGGKHPVALKKGEAKTLEFTRDGGMKIDGERVEGDKATFTSGGREFTIGKDGTISDGSTSIRSDAPGKTRLGDVEIERLAGGEGRYVLRSGGPRGGSTTTGGEDGE